ncbi:MAG TPA: hypothetical protein VMT15_19690 [Bryobacteraceae bacterium]|nr:hypothetical protein [Bryobacteraceae bacterium]
MAFAPIAKADEWDKKTILTVKETIQLPNAILPPGVYTFKLFNSLSDRHTVQVFDQDGKHLVTTVLAIPNYRLEPVEKTEFLFWEVPAGNPPALRAWFYPGDNFGQEFAYPKNISTQIAAIAKTEVPTTTAVTPEEMKTAPITETAPPPVVAAAPPPPVETPKEVAPVAPPPAPVPAEAPELPRTASPVPLIGLLGLVAMAAFFALRPSRVS